MSRGADGAKGNGESGLSDINADGTRVAFVSYATNLADGDTDDKADVHLRDLTADTTRLVSATPGGAKNDGFVQGLSIDASGERVAFEAVATTLPGGTGSHFQVYVRDLAADTLVLASQADGADGARGAGGFRRLGDQPRRRVCGIRVAGRRPGAGTPPGVVETYVRDLAGGRTELVSRESGPAGPPPPVWPRRSGSAPPPAA